MNTFVSVAAPLETGRLRDGLRYFLSRLILIIPVTDTPRWAKLNPLFRGRYVLLAAHVIEIYRAANDPCLDLDKGLPQELSFPPGEYQRTWRVDLHEGGDVNDNVIDRHGTDEVYPKSFVKLYSLERK